MKTRRNHSVAGNNDDSNNEVVDGDPTVIGFRRSRAGVVAAAYASADRSRTNSNASDNVDMSAEAVGVRRSSRLTGNDKKSTRENKKESPSSATDPMQHATRTNKANKLSKITEVPPAFDTVLKVEKKKEAKTTARNVNDKDASHFVNARQTLEARSRKIAAAVEKMNIGTENGSDKHGENNDYDSQHSPPPIREITTTNRRALSSSANGTGENQSTGKTKQSESPKYLDENTLSMMRYHLLKYQGEMLEEDEVVDFMLRLQNIANQQAKYQIALISGPANMYHHSHDDDELSECGSDDTSVFWECLHEEEEHAIGHDMFKKIVTQIQENQKNEPPSKNSDVAKANEQGSVSRTLSHNILDRKTLLWIKRAAGLYRTDRHGILSATTTSRSNPNSKGRMSTRRYTRKQAIERRSKKLPKIRPLDILKEAVDDLEEEFGPFPERPRPRKRYAGRSKKRVDAPARKKQKKTHDKDVRQKQDIQQPKENRKKADREIQIERKDKERKSQRIIRKEKKNGHKSAEGPQNQRIITSLRALDWLWRDCSKQYRDVNVQLETAADFRRRQSIPLHPQFVKSDIVHRLPRMETLAREHEFPLDTPGRVYDPPRRRHNDRQYAEFCARLMKCLQGQARLFATCEFFYSDLDRAWYDHNPFANDLSKLGVTKGTRLKRCEWAALRRRIPHKPRRFSKKFIISQLGDRNEYRCFVRKLQSNPDHSATVKFPYVVYAPIRAGTMVTAYSKRFRIIQRGRVLTYDRQLALYLVEFENVQFGYELCPDSDVATCGMPTILIEAPHVFGKDNYFASYIPGSFTGPIPGLEPAADTIPITSQESSLGFTVLGSDITKNPSNSNVAAQSKIGTQVFNDDRSFLEAVAECDSFVTLMEVVDAARKRKCEVLGLIEDANAFVVNRLPHGEGEEETFEWSPSAKEHLDWLFETLEQTNRIIADGLLYLRTLYGNVYLSSQFNDNTSNTRDTSLKILQASVTTFPYEISQLSRDWAAQFIAKTDDLSSALAWSFGQPHTKHAPDTIYTDGKWTDMRHRIAIAAQLICTASYLQHVAVQKCPPAAISAIPLDVAHGKLTTSLDFPRINFDNVSESELLYDEVVEVRRNAVDELSEAVQLFKTELELSDLSKSISAEKM